MPRMALHPLAEQFGSIAEVYERGRPEYAPAVVGALAAELGLAPGARVLDLAAGTGKLSRALLAAGFDVIAVEPQASLRDLLAGKVGADRALAGVAEQIPLADIRRVLRPGGGLALLSTVPDWSGASWAHELGTLIMNARPAHPHFDGPSWREAIRAAGGWSEPREIRVTTNQTAGPARIVDYVASMSWVAALRDEQRTAMLERVAALVETGDSPSELPLHIVIGLAQLA